MKVHPPDTAWLIRWIGVLNPNDEIFEKSYKFKRAKVEVEISEEEEFLRNDDDFYTDLPTLDDKTIRTTNRMRVPKKVQIARRIKLARATAEKARLREEKLVAYRETLESESDSEFEYQPEAAGNQALQEPLVQQIQTEPSQQQDRDQKQVSRPIQKDKSLSESDEDYEESPQKKGRKQRPKQTPRGKLSLEALEEAKEAPVHKSSIKTRSMKKSDLTEVNDITTRMGDVNMTDQSQKFII